MSWSTDRLETRFLISTDSIMNKIVHPNHNPYQEPEGCLPWILVAIIALLILTGCRSTKYVPVEFHTTDSIVIRDTLVEVQLIPFRDSTNVLPAVGDSTASSFLGNLYAYSWARWDGRMLNHSLGIWPGAITTIRIPYYMDRIRRIEVPVIQEVPIPLNRWQQFNMDFGGVSFGVCIGLTAVLLWVIFIKRRK